MRIFLFLILAGVALTVAAVPMELTMPNRLVALADYREGAANKPAVLLLHGFLQTHESPTIHNLASGIADAGYTVLAPTLTLGVTHRKQTLACEAIHKQTLEDSAKEFNTWVKWLKTRHPGPIVLIGHSFGSAESLAYLSGRHDPAIKRFIGISLVEGRLKLTPAQTERLIADMQQAVKSGTPRMVTHQFSYCEKYQATPASLLSYLEWTPQRVLDAAAHLSVPGMFIMGGSDDRLGSDWVSRLQQHSRVKVFKGANHFMDGNYEFDLLDAVLEELKAT